MKNKKNLILAILLFIILCFLLVILSNINYSWENWRPATCTTTTIGCFCELIRNSTVRQPINTWSSLAFTLIGFLIIAQAKFDARNISNKNNMNLITSKYLYSLIYGFTMVVIGLGSAFYHASLSFVGQTADVIGMYLFVSFFIVYTLSRIYTFEENISAIQFIFLNFIFAYFLIIHPELRRYIFGIALIVALFLEFKLRRKKNIVIDNKYVFIAFFVMLVSFILWLLDTFKVICYPSSVFQLHSIWHLGGAVAAGLLYLYF